MNNKKVDIDENELKRLYLEEQLSTRDIASKLGVGQTTIRRKMAKYNIPARSDIESKQVKPYLEKQKALSDRYKIEYTKTYKKVCEFCGNPFTVVGSSQRNKKYCSKECENNSRKTLERDNNGLLRNTFVCKGCGRTFDNPSKYRIIRYYCDDCLHTHRSISQIKRVEVKCGYCGKPMKIIPSRYKDNEVNYCSVSCMAKDYTRRFSGENSPSWKGGKKHYTGFWQRQRDKARRRDLFKCRVCGITEKSLGKELSVHHIRKYRLFSNKERANSINNLVCLCPTCHSYIHSNKNKKRIYINDGDKLFNIILRYSLFAIENIAACIKLRLELCLGYLAELSHFLRSRLKDVLYH